MKQLLVLPLLIPLSGCMTAVIPALEAAGTLYGRLNANIQQAAQQLHDNCVLLQSGLAIGGVVVDTPAVRGAIVKGEQALAVYCTGAPPVDVPTALAAVARIYRDVIEAKRISAAVLAK